jgi:hypothetical protein
MLGWSIVVAEAKLNPHVCCSAHAPYRNAMACWSETKTKRVYAPPRKQVPRQAKRVSLLGTTLVVVPRGGVVLPRFIKGLRSRT